MTTMNTDIDVRDSIERAAEAVGPVWPLHSFVTANPLAGFEDRPFHEAVREGERLFSANGYPSAGVFRRAWTNGRIDADVLNAELADHGYEADPEPLLDGMAEREGNEPTGHEVGENRGRTATDRVDRLLTKWLAVFSDQGKAHWPMPDRERGFYTAVRTVVRHDREIPNRERLADLPDDPTEAIAESLADRPEGQWEAIFERHLAALPEWTGFVKQRIADDSAWQSTHPITLSGYLAFRLALTDLLDAPMAPSGDPSDPAHPDGDTERRGDAGTGSDDELPLPEIWLSASEATYREQLVDAVADAGAARDAADADDRPDAQLVFCIDTRSEIVRRHVEAAGDYETRGYAGFFGIPMRYEGYDADVTVDARPPILDAEHYVADRPVDGHDRTRDRYDRWSAVRDAGRDLVDALKTNAATAFSFVESAGVGYGIALAARTLAPARVSDLLAAVAKRVPDDHDFCEPAIDRPPSVEHDRDGAGDLPAGLTFAERVEYAATAFELMGWERFGPRRRLRRPRESDGEQPVRFELGLWCLCWQPRRPERPRSRGRL